MMWGSWSSFDDLAYDMNGPLQAEDIISVLRELGGEARFEEIYEAVTRRRGGGYGHYRGVRSYRPTMWQVIYRHLKGSAKYKGPEYFLRTGGRRHSRETKLRLVDSLVGNAVGTLPPPMPTVEAVDVSEPPPRVRSEVYRVLRDTELARRIKALHNCKCQRCHSEGLELPGGKLYAEVHHIQPLGGDHNGPDITGNILCVCPNCHVLLDYGAARLDVSQLDSCPGHQVQTKYVDYHNERIFNRVKGLHL